MAAQQGFAYEREVAKTLKKYGWVKPTYSPAGAASDRPDLDILFEGKEYGCELKLGLASAGSLVIHHLGMGKYAYGDTDGDEEKEFLKGLAEKVDMLSVIERKWRRKSTFTHPSDQHLNYPLLQKDKTADWAAKMENARVHYGYDLRTRYILDKEQCPDIYFQMPSDTISKYYNLKYTHYLNVATHGFYLLGISDPARINRDKFGTEKVPLWDDCHTCVMRVRVQSKGVTKAEQAEKRLGYVKAGAGQGYQFTMELQFKNLTASPYNIGPIFGKGPTIDESKLKLPNREEKVLIEDTKEEAEE
jgi:hypothetical protein